MIYKHKQNMYLLRVHYYRLVNVSLSLDHFYFYLARYFTQNHIKHIFTDSEGRSKVLLDRLTSDALEEESCHTFDDFDARFNHRITSGNVSTFPLAVSMT